LHISPENFLRKLFKKKYKSYISGDLYRKDVDKQFNIEHIPFLDNSFDLVFASHVLEYVENDTQAISEIKRVLRPGGLAMLPVPVIHDKTIDFNERPKNKRIIREIGVDYFNRYRDIFSEVIVYESSEFDEKFNLTIDMQKDLDSDPISNKYQLPNLLPVCRA
jgi:ubiquinone/menaquinone biosynthesis C-methylase UbiE